MDPHAVIHTLQVWDAVAQQIPQRAVWIEDLSMGLEQAEETRRVKVGEAPWGGENILNFESVWQLDLRLNMVAGA